MQRLVAIAFVSLLWLSSSAHAECRCLSVAGEVGGAIQGDLAKADGLYARGDYAAALAIYVKASGSAKTPELIYAQAMAQWQLGAKVEAKALFEKYLAASGTLAFRARAEAAVDELKRDGGVVAGVVGGTTAVVGGLTGNVTGEAAGAASFVGGTAGELRGRVEGKAKPPKLAHGAAVVLGVVAVAAIGVVGIHAIAAGVKDDISLDPKFDLGLGLTGVTVGITAIYLNGLTAATAAVGSAGSVRCAELPKGRPIVAPVALHGGGGLAAAMSF